MGNKTSFTNIDELPLTMKVEHLALALNISRANAYILANSDGFPVIRLGKRILVYKHAFIKWVEDQLPPNSLNHN